MSLNVFLALLYCLTLIPCASAAMLPAGYVITNQAIAEYDFGDQSFNVTSNAVESVVAARAVVSLYSSQTQTSTPGYTVTFSHRITNIGNINDSYNLTAELTSGSLTDIQIYADSTGKGKPDNTTPITSTPILQPGGVYNVVVVAKVPENSAPNSVSTLNLTATSQLSNSVNAVNTDKVQLTQNAFINLNTTLDKEAAKSGDQIKVTLNIKNNGTTASGNVNLSDMLPSEFEYIPGSARWSISGDTALNDSNATDNPKGIKYDYNITKQGAISAVIDSIAAGQTQSITFYVKIKEYSLETYEYYIYNSCAAQYKDSQNGTVIQYAQSNDARLQLLPSLAVVVSDKGSKTDTGGTLENGIVEPKGPFFAGGVVIFDDVVYNNGNIADIYDLTYNKSSFPAGTTFTFVKRDGQTLQSDTDNTGIPDTGIVPAHGFIHVYLKAQLPASQKETGPFDVTVQATSKYDKLVYGSIINRISSIQSPSVDLTQTATGEEKGNNVVDGGWGPGPETVAQMSNAINPGSSTTFPLFINHYGPNANTYTLQYSTDPAFATLGGLPQGWSVKFVNLEGKTIADASLAASKKADDKYLATQYGYKAIVTAPSNAATGQYNIYFRVVSTDTGAADTLYDQVTINAEHNITLLPSNVGQVQPGGVVVYTHELKNLGNVTETQGAFTLTSNNSDWAVAAFLDVNNSGVYEAGTDPEFSNLSQIPGGLKPGQSYTLFVRVQAPVQAKSGQSQVTNLSINLEGVKLEHNSAVDQTSIVSGAIQLLKTQALDKGCTGNPDAPLSTARIPAINPNECIIYRLTATNLSALSVKNLKIRDDVPANMTLLKGPSVGGEATGGEATTSKLDGSTTVQAVIPLIESGKNFYLQFEAKLGS